MNYNTISARRIAGALGAEIAGVDLSRPLSDEVIGEIRRALLDHQVIFFHDQHLTPEQHLASAARPALIRFLGARMAFCALRQWMTFGFIGEFWKRRQR